MTLILNPINTSKFVVTVVTQLDLSDFVDNFPKFIRFKRFWFHFWVQELHFIWSCIPQWILSLLELTSCSDTLDKYELWCYTVVCCWLLSPSLFLHQSMNCPPTKRLRGRDRVTTMDFDDPFGDDEGFTQDDLNEIDILASQAITSAPAPGPGSTAGTKPTELAQGSAGQSRTVGRATTNQSRENTFGFCSSNKGNSGIQSRDPIGEFRAQLITEGFTAPSFVR